MTITIARARELKNAVDQFGMTAALDNMQRYGSQLCMAPSEGGLMDYATTEVAALLVMVRNSNDEHCSADAETAVRQMLNGALISMAAGSSGGREVDALIRDAAVEFDAESIEKPHIAATSVMWRKDPIGDHKAHEALITLSQIEAAGPMPKGGERKLIKTILERRYQGTVHQLKYRQLADGFIPGPIHERVQQHETYFASVLRRPIPTVPTDERQILGMMQARAQNHLSGMMRRGRMTGRPEDGRRDIDA